MNEATDKLEWEWVEEPAAELLRVLFDYKPLSSGDVRRLREGLVTEPILTLRLAECLARGRRASGGLSGNAHCRYRSDGGQ